MDDLKNSENTIGSTNQDRYQRMRQLGLSLEGIFQSHVLVIGAGGVGSPLLLYLAGAGVRHISICDGDTVALTNLQRQILYKERDIGKVKVDMAAMHLKELNSTVNIYPYSAANTDQEMEDIILGRVQKPSRDVALDLDTDKPPINLVIECTDNASSMVRVHNLCLKHKLPLMLISAEGFDFSVLYYDFKDKSYLEKYGCLGCLGYNPMVSRAFPGILGPTAGLAGVYGAFEALKILGGGQSNLYGHLAYSRNGVLSFVELAKDEGCVQH